MSEKYPCYGSYRTLDVFCQSKCEFRKDCEVETNNQGDNIMSATFDLPSAIEEIESHKEKYIDPNEYGGIDDMLSELELFVYDITANIGEEDLQQICEHYGVNFSEEDTANELILSLAEFIKSNKASDIRKTTTVPDTEQIEGDIEQPDDDVPDTIPSDVVEVVGEEEEEEINIAEESEGLDATSEVGQDNALESLEEAVIEEGSHVESEMEETGIVELVDDGSVEEDISDPDESENEELVTIPLDDMPSVDEAIEQTKPEVLEKPTIREASSPLYEAVQANSILMGINQMVNEYTEILWTGKKSFLLDLQNSVNFLVEKNKGVPEDGGIPKIKTISARRTVKRSSVALPDPPSYFYDVAKEYGFRCQQEGNKFVARDTSDGDKGKGYIVYRLMYDKDVESWNLEMPQFRGFERIELFEGVTMKSKTVAKIPSSHEKAQDHLNTHIESYKYEKVTDESGELTE